MVTKRQAEDRCREYLAHLYDVFIYLAAFQEIQAHVQTIRQSCATNADALAALKTKGRAFREFVVSLSPNWEIPVDPCPVHGVTGATKLIVGGSIHVSEGPTLLQSIVVGLLLESQEHVSANNNKQAERLSPGDRVLIRRFHFDYDTDLQNSNWPRSHLQYGG